MQQTKILETLPPELSAEPYDYTGGLAANAEHGGFSVDTLPYFPDPLPIADLKTAAPTAEALSRYGWSPAEDLATISRAVNLHQLESGQRKASHERHIRDMEADPDGWPMDKDTGLSRVRQLFTLKSYGQTVRMYDLSQAIVPKSHLVATANVLAALDEQTGGALSEAVPIVVILPADHPKFINSDGESHGGLTKIVSVKGEKQAVVLLSEKLLMYNPAEQEVPAPIQVEAVHDEPRTTRLGRLALRLSGSKSRGNSVGHRHVVNAGQQKERAFETTLAHEFTHALQLTGDKRWNSATVQLQKGAARNELKPSRYSSANAMEQLAEIGAGRFLGGVFDQAVGPEQRRIHADFIAHVNAGHEGPAYVRVEEIDLLDLVS